MKIYAVRNVRSKGSANEDEEMGGFHSGGCVVMAHNLEEAIIEIRDKLEPKEDDWDYKHLLTTHENELDWLPWITNLEEVIPNEAGIASLVLFADGDC